MLLSSGSISKHEQKQSMYCPGLHLLAEMTGINSGLLSNCNDTRALIDSLIDQFQLHSLGSVYHEFPDGGFTAVVCLTESHLSIHTWPEFGIVTADVFLSNYRNDNSEKAKTIMKSIIELYGCTDFHLSEIHR